MTRTKTPKIQLRAPAAAAMAESWFKVRMFWDDLWWDDPPDGAITQDGSTIEVMIYDEIGAYGVKASTLVEKIREFGDISRIEIILSSPGGDAFDGLTLNNFLRSHPAEVAVRIDGLCASAATLVACAGDHVQMSAGALYMIHNPVSYGVGEADEFRSFAEMLDQVKEAAIACYLAKSTTASKDEFASMMDATTWLTGEEALSAGLVDEVLKPAAPAQMSAAGLRLIAGYDHVPKALMTAVKRAQLELQTMAVKGVGTRRVKLEADDPKDPKDEGQGAGTDEGNPPQPAPEDGDTDQDEADAIADRFNRDAGSNTGKTENVPREVKNRLMRKGYDAGLSYAMNVAFHVGLGAKMGLKGFGPEKVRECIKARMSIETLKDELLEAEMHHGGGNDIDTRNSRTGGVRADRAPGASWDTKLSGRYGNKAA